MGITVNAELAELAEGSVLEKELSAASAVSVLIVVYINPDHAGVGLYSRERSLLCLTFRRSVERHPGDFSQEASVTE